MKTEELPNTFFHEKTAFQHNVFKNTLLKDEF